MPHSENRADILIIGAGPAGLFAAFQCGMLKLSCIIIDTLPTEGGQCNALYPKKPIFDIPAYPQISAETLISQLKEQLKPFNVPVHCNQTACKLEENDDGMTVTTTSGDQFHAKAVIVAVGSGAFGPNRPPLDGIESFEETGHVHYHVNNPSLFKDQEIVIAGGGDSALDWALDLAPSAKKIYLVHRRDKFRALPQTLEQIEPFIKEGKIEKVIPFQLKGLHGNNKTLEAVEVASLDGETRKLPATHLLAFFGLSSDLSHLADWGMGLERNLIPVNPATLETARKHVFAIGDVATYPGKMKLILQGFSEASMAVHAAWSSVHPDQAFHFEHSTNRGS